MRAFPAARLPRRHVLAAVAAATMIISLLAAITVSAQAPGNPNPDALWVGGSGGAVKYAAADGSPLLQLAGRDDIRALAVDRRRGGIWLTDGRVLEHWSADGSALWSRQVPIHRNDDDDDDVQRRSNRVHLFADAKTGGAWLLRRHAATRFGADGERHARVDLRRSVFAAGFDGARGRLWVATSRSIRAYDREGRAVAELDGVRPSRVRAIAYGSGGDADNALWLATSQELLRYDAESLDRQLRLRLRKLRHLAADGAGGVWAAADKRLRYLDASGGIQLDLRRPLDRDRIIDLAANPADRSVWVAGDDELVRVRANGVAAARIDLPRRGVPGRVAALGLFADVHAPALEWIAPADEAVLADAAPALRLAHEDHGSGADVGSLQIEVGGQPLAIDCQPAESSGEAACTLSALLDQGTNILSATVADHAGNLSEPAERLLVIDTIAPAISFDPPVDGTWTNADAVMLAGQLSEAADLKVDGEPVSANLDRRFAHNVALASDGAHGIELVAKDAAGNQTLRTLVVHRDTVPPGAAAAEGITVEPGAVDGTIRLTGEPGSVEPEAEVVIANTRTGKTIVVQADENGAFTASVVGENSDDYEITVRDRAGNESAPSNISGNTFPPDPAAVAPPLMPGSSFQDQTAFLYERSDPIQTGVAPNAIEKHRAAVVRGRVINRAGVPLPGVTISVAGHPEYGQTISRADGRYDLAVNGGGVVTLNYDMDERLPAQRTVDVPWADYAHAPEVALVRLDGRVTRINLANDSEPFQIARGSSTEDADGQRQATLLFPSGTTAEIATETGETRQLTELSVRATEYTAGDSGPAAMPGELPAMTGYTYAVEFSVDEALEAGADVVRFNQPVPFYIDNFLDFPAGEPVPTGYYDRTKSAWIPYENGLIVEVLSEQNGRAVLDVSGDGEPASPADYEGLNLTVAERGVLAELYEPGDSLWRVTLDHFSPWDCNWPYGPADDIPLPPEYEPPAEDEVTDCEESEQQGCIINAQSQTLKESIPFEGTSLSLHYSSRRQAGYRSDRRAVIPITDDRVLPDGLMRIEATVSIAGQKIARTFVPEPNQDWTFEWDGLDAHGRPVIGARTAQVRVRYVSRAVYLGAAGLSRAFARASSGGIGLSSSAGRMEVGQTREFEITLRGKRSPAAAHAGLGGWTLSTHHAFLPETDSLERGDGRDISRVGRLEREEEIFAGTGRSGYGGDGGPATEARLSRGGSRGAHYLAVGPDGTVYIMDDGNHRIRAVANDGIIRTVAGNGTKGNDGDGGPATEARIDIDKRGRITVGPRGNLFIAQQSRHVVRRVSPDGIITTVAGNGSNGHSGDGGLATQAQLSEPTDVAVSADGTIFISEYGNHAIRVVSPDGVISTIDAPVYYPMEIWVTGEGVLYVRDHPTVSAPTRLWRRDLDGNFTEVTRNFRRVWRDPYASHLEEIPEEVKFTAGPSGTWYTHRGERIVKKEPVLARPIGGSAVPARSGDTMYQFGPDRRHTHTVSTTGGHSLNAFEYTPDGLSRVLDADGNAIEIERSAAGMPTAFIAPDGERTELLTDSSGRLAVVTDPSGQEWRMSYQTGGLLESFTDRADAMNTFGYDHTGRLVADQGPENSGWSLSRAEIPGGVEVSMVSASGRAYQYAVTASSGDGYRQTNTAPDGSVTEKVFDRADRSVTVKHPSGTEFERVDNADPRFHWRSPYAGRTEISLPSGLTRVSEQERTAEVPSGTSLIEPKTMARSASTNGRTTRAAYDSTDRTWTYITPENRESITTIDGAGRPTRIDIDGLAPVEHTFDTRGRLAEIRHTTGVAVRATTYTYSDAGPQAGYLGSVTDALGRSVTFERDANGRVIEQTLPDGRAIRFEYDPEGRVTRLEPPGQPAHVMTYDGNGERTAYDPPDVSEDPDATQYRFNADRQLTRVERPSGETVAFSYDPGGRLSQRNGPTGTTDYSYHAQTGQLASIDVPGGGGLAFEWDGFLPTGTTWTGPVAGTVGREYDNNFWLTGETVGGRRIGFGHDADGLLTQAGSLSIERDPAHGLVTGTTQANVTGQRAYNAFGELDTRSVSVGADSAYAVDYERDAVGRIIEKTETLGGETQTTAYTYDAAGRLTEVTRDGTLIHLYQYDANGNRIRHLGPSGEVTASYDAQDRLLTYGDAAYTHTPSGERRTKTTPEGRTTYDYDSAGNLRQVALPDGTTVEYLIDGQNRRIGKKVNGVLEKGWVYRDRLNPVAELNGNGDVTRRFVYGDRANVPAYMIAFDPGTGGETTYRIVSDHLGSVRLVVNADTGRLVQRVDYSPYGRVTRDSNPGFQPFGFAGGLYEGDTALTRLGARDYDGEIGGWTAKDPILFRGGDTNLYGYVLSDPVNLFDANGMRSGARRSVRSGQGTAGNPRPRGRDFTGRRGSWHYGQFYPTLGETVTPRLRKQNEFGIHDLLPKPKAWREFYEPPIIFDEAMPKPPPICR